VKVSVLMPAYNAARTISAALDSVLRQTSPADEILVLDDGSTDETLSILNSFKPRITVIEVKPNAGICAARNLLCRRATGDMITLLDADDMWHPRYLEVKSKLFADYPKASVQFVGHKNFSGYSSYEWQSGLAESYDFRPEVIDSQSFFERYNQTPGQFYPSVCSFSKLLLQDIGEEPFKTAAEDAYFLYSAILTGAAVYVPIALAAIRAIDGSLSSNQLKQYLGQVQAFELLNDKYMRLSNSSFKNAFKKDFAGVRRQYAKRLMGASQVSEARRELVKSLGNSTDPRSIAKSSALLAASFLPAAMQPRWPPPYRNGIHKDKVATD
jgi:glycosyltransferase involved in cell wall biosynthesis